MTKTTLYTKKDYLAVIRKLQRAGQAHSVRPVVKLSRTVAWVVTY